MNIAKKIDPCENTHYTVYTYIHMHVGCPPPHSTQQLVLYGVDLLTKAAVVIFMRLGWQAIVSVCSSPSQKAIAIIRNRGSYLYVGMRVVEMF